MAWFSCIPVNTGVHENLSDFLKNGCFVFSHETTVTLFILARNLRSSYHFTIGTSVCPSSTQYQELQSSSAFKLLKQRKRVRDWYVTFMGAIYKVSPTQFYPALAIWVIIYC